MKLPRCGPWIVLAGYAENVTALGDANYSFKVSTRVGTGAADGPFIDGDLETCAGWRGGIESHKRGIDPSAIRRRHYCQAIGAQQGAQDYARRQHQFPHHQLAFCHESACHSDERCAKALSFSRLFSRDCCLN